MINFVNIKTDDRAFFKVTQACIFEVFKLFEKYSKYLHDDYFQAKSDQEFEEFLCFLESLMPYFWIMTDGLSNEFMGFVYLENVIGNCENLHSAEVTACFDKKFWGKYTKLATKEFVEMCFKDLGLKKLKAVVCKENFRVKPLLKVSGFNLEATLKSETVKDNKLQDIEIYSIIKDEVKNDTGNRNKR